MKLVHYDDESIWLNGTEYRFEDFKKLHPNYLAPWGFPIRMYDSGKIHYVSDGKNTVYLSLFSEDCDRICDREGELARLSLRLRKERGER